MCSEILNILLPIISMRTMSETNEFITHIHDCTVKEFMEPVHTSMFFVERTADIPLVFSVLCKRHHVWVVDNKKTLQLIGVITESDTLPLFASPSTPLQSFDKPTLQSFQYGLSPTAEEIMSKKPVTVFSEEKMANVIEKMRQHKIKQVAVIDKNETLQGEVTLSRLIQEFPQRKNPIPLS